MRMRITIDLEFDSQAYADDNTFRVNTPEYMTSEMQQHIMHVVKNRFEPSSYTFNAHVIDNGAGFNDPTGFFDGHIDGGMHDGCPCGACTFCRGSEVTK